MNKNQKRNIGDTKNSDMEKENFTREEVEELISKKVKEALSSANEEWDKERESIRKESEKFALMPADERARAELEKKESAFNAEREEYLKEKMEFEAIKALADENLPLGFAKLLSGKDREETSSNIDMFKTEFLKAIEEALAKRLKGHTPKTVSAVKENDPFLAGFGN